MFRKVFESLVPPSGGQRFPALDGLRALAALGVVALHAVVMFNWKPPYGPAFWKLGTMSVCSFFVLSAFLLYYPVAAGKQFNIALYFKRRFFRIMPAYLVLTVLSVIIALLLNDKAISTADMIGLAKSVLRWTTFSHGLGLFQHHGGHHGLRLIAMGGTWSLAPEVHFYLLLPLLVLVMSRRSWRIIASIAVIFFLQTTVAGDEKDNAPLFHSILLLLLPFLFGMLAAWVVAKYEKSSVSLAALAPLGLLILYAYPISPFFGLNEMYPGVKGYFTALANPRGLWPSLGCALAVVGLTANLGWCAKFMSMRWLRLLGICSYGMFLFNWPVFYLLHKVSHGNLIIVMMGIPISIGLGIASYLLIEAPAMRYAARKPAPKVVPEVVAISSQDLGSTG